MRIQARLFAFFAWCLVIGGYCEGGGVEADELNPAIGI